MNEEQKKAVKYNKGPLLIIAGAGTGKTRVIVEKIKYLISNNLAKPEQILALTFTEKAAQEMEERIDQALPYGYFQMWISTFHSFADRILKEEAHAIGLNLSFRLLTEAETIIFLRKNLFLFNLHYFRPLGNPNKFLEALLQHFSRLRDEDISPNEYLDWVQLQKSKPQIKNQEEKIEIEKYLELANAYKTYQTLKTKEGVFDFADLVFYLNELFRQRPNIVKKYQQQFRYVLVDEFQDTNIAQYQLIKLLCPAKANPKLTVVGDDSQSIYKFRGASVSNILTFMKDYPQAKQITLRQNYRSNQTILDAAYRLIKHNNPDTLEFKLGISKNLIAQKKDRSKEAVNFYLAKTAEEEADYVCKQILKLKKFYQFSDFAILARANNHLAPFIRALARHGIPYQFAAPGMLFKQSEVKDLIAYLKVLYNPEDSASLFRVLSMDIFAIDNRDLTMLLSMSYKLNLSLFQTIEVYLSFFYKQLYVEEFEIYAKYLPFLKKETREKLYLIYQMIRRQLGLVKKETAGQILYYFLEDSN
ncbi:MAG: ATP-dependent helicase, partial [Microgenomates group bacterium]